MSNFIINDESWIGEARRKAKRQAKRLGFDQVGIDKIAIMVNEIASNLLKHADEGELIIDSIKSPEKKGIEILAFDRGKGISDLDLAFQDGFSTSQSLGFGLGSLKRLSDFIDVYSLPEQGTILLVQSWLSTKNKTNFKGQVGSICLPKADEKYNGDAWAYKQKNDLILTLLVDGLGHGPAASQAAQKAKEVFNKSTIKSPAALIEEIHNALKGTRGAAISITKIEPRNKQITYAGIGNLSALIISPDRHRSLVSHYGIVGYSIRKIQELNDYFERNDLLVLHSDGISNRWDLDSYPNLVEHHPKIIAGTLYRDFHHDQDDSTIIIFKNNRGAKWRP